MRGDWMLPNPQTAPTRQPRVGEPLFAFTRPSDDAPITCELRFNGEEFGWEALFLDRGELLCSRGAFATRAMAMQWAEEERKVIEQWTDG